jgi:hypothetical protein
MGGASGGRLDDGGEKGERRQEGAARRSDADVSRRIGACPSRTGVRLTSPSAWRSRTGARLASPSAWRSRTDVGLASPGACPSRTGVRLASPSAWRSRTDVGLAWTRARPREEGVGLDARLQGLGRWSNSFVGRASRAHNSAVECVLHTDEVAGSIPAAPTGIAQVFGGRLERPYLAVPIDRAVQRWAARGRVSCMRRRAGLSAPRGRVRSGVLRRHGRRHDARGSRSAGVRAPTLPERSP